jgi:hypothetical protein
MPAVALVDGSKIPVVPAWTERMAGATYGHSRERSASDALELDRDGVAEIAVHERRASFVTDAVVNHPGSNTDLLLCI